MKFTEILKEGAEEKSLTGPEIAKVIENNAKKVFSDSYIKFKFTPSIAPSVSGIFALNTEWSNGIIQNDPVFHQFFVWGFDKEGNGVNLQAENPVGSIRVKATDKRFAFDSVKSGFRKKKGNGEVIIKHFDNFFKKLKVLIEENKKDMR